MTTLTKAHHQWAIRAADERFASVQDMHDKAVKDRFAARIASNVEVSKLKAIADGHAVKLEGKSGTVADLTNWSFGQLASKAEAPAGYLQTLPAKMAADCLNHGLSGYVGNDAAMLFSQSDNSLTARAITSARYSRIWNSDVTERLLDLEAEGTWQPAPAAFDGSRGLYLSDRDMFAFMVDNNRRIFEKLPGGGLSRGFFLWNSEVGAASIGVMTFLYEYVCGNHRVWGAKEVKEISFRHIGEGLDRKAFGTLEARLIDYANGSADADEAKIERMRTTIIAADKQGLLDALFQRLKISKKLAAQTVELAEAREDWYGNPRSVWGVAGALTEIARDMPNADKRDELNRIGAKLMEMQF